MRKNPLPGWLTVLLVLVGLVVLGPPALALLAAAIGITIALAAVALKVGVVVLVVLAFVALMKAVFGKSEAKLAPPPQRPGIETISAAIEREERERTAALDRELEAAIRHAS